MLKDIRKVLFIRRDNIGDLICTTPAFRAAREKFPNARTGILVNSYNADAIKNNPDIDEIYIYQKAKHAPDKSKLSVWLHNISVLWKIRREKYDVAIGFGSYSPTLVRYTALTGVGTTIGYLKKGTKEQKSYTIPVCEPEGALHEVERAFSLLTPLGITGNPDALRVFPAEADVEKVRRLLAAAGIKTGRPLVAFHISSRRPENRWPPDKFVELSRLVSDRCGAAILLLWSPGSESNAQHPGDDEKAEYILNLTQQQTIAFKTARLGELIAALSLCALVVCCDGGAMHIAAALGKPIVTIWGSTNPDTWRPWAARHVLLQNKSKRADDISVDEALKAVEKLLC